MDVILDLVAPTPEVVAIDVVNPNPTVQLTVVTGASGSDGVGVIPGGTTGQVLAKASNTNFDTVWEDPAAGTVASVNTKTGIVSLTQDDIPDGTTAKQFSSTEKTKLAGVASGAQVNTVASVAGKTGAVTLVKGDVGLANVDNTADTAKPVSTAQQTALNGKANTTHTHAESDVTGLTTDLAGKQPLDSDLTAIAALTPTDNDFIQRKASAWVNRTPAQAKTDLSLTKSDVGLANVDNTSDANKPVSTAQQAALDLKAPLASPAFTGTPTGITKTHVGLGNVDNTADTAKPVSTAQQTALDARMVWADGSTSTNARPSTSSKVIWVGGTTQPVNMLTGDLWVKA
jgi:hypothetical protein